MVTRTKTNRNNGNTRKRYSNTSSTNSNFEKQITVTFLEMLLMVKLFHWKTHSYATHKATDELYSKLNQNIDHFIEVLLGKMGGRVNLMNVKMLPLKDFDSINAFKREIESYKRFLINLDNQKSQLIKININDPTNLTSS